MNTLINSIANFFISHPLAQVIAGYSGQIVGCFFTLFLIAGCLFLTFGKQKSFCYHAGSFVGRCWKAGWLLMIIAVVDLSRHMFSGMRNFSTAELIFDCIPIAILLFAQIYGSKHHRSLVAARREAKLKLL